MAVTLRIPVCAALRRSRQEELICVGYSSYIAGIVAAAATLSKAKNLEELILVRLITATSKMNITNLATEIQKSKGHVTRAINKMIQEEYVTIKKDWIRAGLDPRSNIVELEWKGFVYGVVKYNIEAENYLQRIYSSLSKTQREYVRVFSKVPDTEQRQLAWWHVLKYERETGRKFGSAKCDKKIMFRIISDKRFYKPPFAAAFKIISKTNPKATKEAYSKLQRSTLKNVSKVGKAIAA
jgi:hypothetical protein